MFLSAHGKYAKLWISQDVCCVLMMTHVTRQKFYVHTTPEESKNPTITGHVEFVLEENAGGEITWSSWRHVFSSTPAFSNSFDLKSVFRKAPFLRRIIVDGRSNPWNKARFSDFSDLVWTLPERWKLSRLSFFVTMFLRRNVSKSLNSLLQAFHCIKYDRRFLVVHDVPRYGLRDNENSWSEEPKPKWSLWPIAN